MVKYEIMMIVDPKADSKIAFDLLNEVFGAGVKKAEKLEKNELAYEINKSKFAQYIQAEVETEANLPAEFTRRANIIKQIWRTLVINLDSEKGLNSSKKEKPNRKRRTFKPYDKNNTRNENNSTENTEKPRRRTTVKIEKVEK
ncbi:30S ribosomal protein S6 [Mycoplasma sp. CSL7503-lung]|uniref:30S ribosomal protein S6 n=1 Tax=Mycoplasma sp. CSL7503-lung TaxID=536372 RepID=UPI0021D1F547|nr:30S ribosomal protein S6 [Mycoplasma sp. CSL7503-lung]MCU4706528.1 30S ribosomal protein S6 [Mycoplasma sp. CSL7503-lung]